MVTGGSLIAFCGWSIDDLTRTVRPPSVSVLFYSQVSHCSQKFLLSFFVGLCFFPCLLSDEDCEQVSTGENTRCLVTETPVGEGTGESPHSFDQTKVVQLWCCSGVHCGHSNLQHSMKRGLHFIALTVSLSMHQMMSRQIKCNKTMIRIDKC